MRTVRRIPQGVATQIREQRDSAEQFGSGGAHPSAYPWVLTVPCKSAWIRSVSHERRETDALRAPATSRLHIQGVRTG
jgi:hypothetical protein